MARTKTLVAKGQSKRSVTDKGILSGEIKQGAPSTFGDIRALKILAYCEYFPSFPTFWTPSRPAQLVIHNTNIDREDTAHQNNLLGSDMGCMLSSRVFWISISLLLLRNALHRMPVATLTLRLSTLPLRPLPLIESSTFA